MKPRTFVLIAWLLLPITASAQENLSQYIRTNYTKQSYQIPMRDGVKLYTIVYTPRDTAQPYPIIMTRTPYSIAPYGADKFRASLGPNPHFARERYIFVYQDVRGRFMSEGEFVNMRPQRLHHDSPTDIDESTDTYDTIDWLIKNIPGHNGKVGLWGISYPGFYTSAGMINAHPALKAASPQAPIADWFFDDFFHHGAFFLPHAFNFFARFGHARPKPTLEPATTFQHGTPDGYQFFLDIGPLKNANRKYFKNQIAFWNEMAEHPNYDEFWQARNLLPHLKKVAPAVMVVGGWYDAEDLYGICQTYRAVEKQNPGIFNVFVMGPWAHGAWSRADATRLGNIHFGSNTSAYFQKELELPFFNHFLKGKGEHGLPEATMFETGTNRWRQFDAWPPVPTARKSLHLHPKGRLKFEPTLDDGFASDAFLSDPHKPVPFTEAISTAMTQEYMTDDQRFASRRPDVLTFQTDVLKQDLTLAGPLLANLWVSTSGSDSDWIVKLIDVFPPDASGIEIARPLGGYQMLVRSEVLRGRFRNSYSKPEPFVANQPSRISLPLQDVLHTFKKGHRVMIQVSSTWFPLVDRNPQKFVPNIFKAEEDDFIPATQRVFRSKSFPSAIQVGILEN